MRAQPRRKTRFYFCPEERDGALKTSELGVIAQHPFLGSGVASVWGDGEAELSVHGLFLGSLQFPAAYEGFTQGAKQKSLPPNLLDFTTHLENR